MNASEMLEFHVRKDIVYLYKRMLAIAEDIRIEREDFTTKLESMLPSEYHNALKACNGFDKRQYAIVRKKILDDGNESIRHLQEQLNHFNVEFKQKVYGKN